MGVITTYAGTGSYGYSGDGGPATAAKTCAWDVYAYDPASVHFAFENPTAYISEFHNNRIRYVNSAGVIITAAGNGSGVFSGDGGPATAAGINGAKSMASDGYGNLYIAEVYGDRIRKVNTSGIITTYADRLRRQHR